MIMKLSGAEALPPVEDSEQPKTLATHPSVSSMLATTTPAAPSESGVEGEFTSSDIKLPYLNLTQKMSKGELAEFGFGVLVFDKAVKVGDVKQCAEIVVLRLRKQYVQVLDRDSQDMPKIYDRIADAKADGLIEQGPSNRKIRNGSTFTERGLLQLAVKAPKDATEDALVRFPYSNNGDHWGLALYIAQSTAYSGTVRVVYTHTMPGQALHTGLHLGRFELHVAKEVNDKKDEFAVPKLRFVGLNTPEDAEFFRSIRGA